MSSSVKKALAGVLAAALLLLLSGCGGKTAMEAPELLEPKGVTLDTAAVRRGTIQTVTTYEGLVLPAVRELSFTVSGVMTGVNVCAGSRVKAGQELASLDVSRYASALESMESYLAYADENEAILEREQEIQIELAKLELAEKRAAGAGQNTLRLLELKIEEQENSLAETRALWELDRSDQVKSIEDLRAVVDSSRLLAPCDGTIVSCTAADGAYAMENMGVIWLAAMIGGTDENVMKLAQECDVDVANFNCPGQTVVSGTEEGVDKAMNLYNGKGTL